MFDAAHISRATAEGALQVPWLASLEPLLQTARVTSQWALWLDKFSFSWAERVEKGVALLEQQRKAAKDTGDRETERRIKAALEKIPSGKAAALSVSCDLIRQNEPNLAATMNARQSWLKALAAQHGSRFRSVRLFNISPLILHLGRASVLENVGIYCERSTGLPIIPGTAVKGVLSTWACWEANQDEDGSFPDPLQWQTQRSDYPADLARRIFGSDAESGSDAAGEIIFLGAWPATLPKLTLDITNPHHDVKMVAGTLTRTDRERLTPSVFLSLAAGTAWDFAIIARVGAPDSSALLSATETWLRECLSQVGLGAKTAAGYGRFGDQTAKPISAASANTVSAADAALQAQAAKDLQSDYPNEATFKNLVLGKLTPALLDQLKNEIPKLQKPENADWLEKLKLRLAGKEAKDLRKRLKEKDWFPQEWLPQQP